RTDDFEAALQLAEHGVLERPLQAVRVRPRRLDPIGVHELGRRRAQHLERARQQPALGAMCDLRAPDSLQRLAIRAPERALLRPHRRLEQKSVSHGIIMARKKAWGYVARKRQLEGVLC